MLTNVCAMMSIFILLGVIVLLKEGNKFSLQVKCTAGGVKQICMWIWMLFTSWYMDGLDRDGIMKDNSLLFPSLSTISCKIHNINDVWLWGYITLHALGCVFIQSDWRIWFEFLSQYYYYCAVPVLLYGMNTNLNARWSIVHIQSHSVNSVDFLVKL